MHQNDLEDLVVVADHKHQSVLGRGNQVHRDLTVPEVVHRDQNDQKAAHQAQNGPKADHQAQNGPKVDLLDLNTQKVDRQHRNDPKAAHQHQNVQDLAVARMIRTLPVPLKSASEKFFPTQIPTMHQQSRYQ